MRCCNKQVLGLFWQSVLAVFFPIKSIYPRDHCTRTTVCFTMALSRSAALLALASCVIAASAKVYLEERFLDGESPDGRHTCPGESLCPRPGCWRVEATRLFWLLW